MGADPIREEEVELTLGLSVGGNASKRKAVIGSGETRTRNPDVKSEGNGSGSGGTVTDPNRSRRAKRKSSSDDSTASSGKKLTPSWGGGDVTAGEMPLVMTMGSDGRRMSGFLYRYNEREISIVCVCHGSSFSPRGFVRHAGGVEGAHPLRQIVVVNPS